MLWKEVVDNNKMEDFFIERVLNEEVLSQCYAVAIPVSQFVAESDKPVVVIVRSGLLNNPDGSFTDINICKAFINGTEEEFTGFILLKTGTKITEARAISHTSVTSQITGLQ
jgi:BioD-like phosphotransacetylase family protein